jgi:hypothetical protein
VSEGAWFSALGEPLGDAERGEIAAYLSGFDLSAPIRPVANWAKAGKICKQPAEAWWRLEERERERLEKTARSGCADAALIRAAAGAASHAAYQARLARAAGAPPGHPFLRKYALYCGGRWPLGVYEGQFAIF